MSPISVFDVFIWTLALTYLLSPGWCFIFWLFPDERPMWQIAVGGAMGTVLLGLMVLGLSSLPLGITHDALVIAVVLLNGLLAILFLWAPQRVSERLFQLVSILESFKKFDWKGHVPVAFTLLALATFLIVTPSLTQGQKESYTEFYIVDGLLTTPPWRHPVNASDLVPLTFSVISHEQTSASFQVHVVTEGETIQVVSLGVLEPDTGVEQSISLPPRIKSEQRYALILYKGDSNDPYRTLYFWLRMSPQRFDVQDEFRYDSG